MNALVLAPEEFSVPRTAADRSADVQQLKALRAPRTRQPRFTLSSAALLVVVFGLFGLWINS